MNRYDYKKAIINAEKLDAYLAGKGKTTPVIIYGAGENGRFCAQHLLRIGAKIKCFVDMNKDCQNDRPYFIDVVSPQAMKANYHNEVIIITPYSGGEMIEEFLALADFPRDRIYRLQFDLESFTLTLPDIEQHKPSQLDYAETASKNPPITVFSLIYNTPEHYLRRSIESVLNQSFRNFEYFIVDHGSDDGTTSRIIKEYESLDKRIKVYRTEVNVEVERQQGREAAPLREALFQEIRKRVTTEYLCWLDSDDCYFDGYLEYTYAIATKQCADMVCVQSTVYEEGNHENLRYQRYPILSNEITTKNEKEKWLAFCEAKMPNTGWGVLVKSEVYLNSFHMAWSHPGGLTTDLLSSFEMLKASKTVIFTRKTYHAYTLRPTSVFRGSKSHDWKYTIMWFEWMINGWLRETRDNYLNLNLSEDWYAYSSGYNVVDAIFSHVDILIKYRAKQELIEFYYSLKKLLADEYLLRVINSREVYKELYKKIASYFDDTVTI